MRQESDSENYVVDGNPSGGWFRAKGIDIKWQKGPLGRGEERIEPNGAFAETVLEAVKQRLEFYQEASDGRFACNENAIAIEHIKTALFVLNERTASREARQVEGTHEA